MTKHMTFPMQYTDEPWKREGSRRPDFSRIPVGYTVPLRDLPPAEQAQFIESLDNPPEPYSTEFEGFGARLAFRLADSTAQKLGILPVVDFCFGVIPAKIEIDFYRRDGVSAHFEFFAEDELWPVYKSRFEYSPGRLLLLTLGLLTEHLGMSNA